MPSFSFVFATVSAEKMHQLEAMASAKRTLMATMYKMEAGVPLNRVQAETLHVGQVDFSLYALLKSITLQECEQLCAIENASQFSACLTQSMRSRPQVSMVLDKLVHHPESPKLVKYSDFLPY